MTIRSDIPTVPHGSDLPWNSLVSSSGRGSLCKIGSHFVCSFGKLSKGWFTFEISKFN